MDKLHRVYQLTITTLSPLHIGTGNSLLRDYDYVVHNGYTWVIDHTTLAEAAFQHGALFDRMVKEGVPAADMLTDGDFVPDSPLFRYRLRGEPHSQKRGAELQEQIKDAWDRPYLPGSSLKGALRTALAFVGWQQRKLRFNPDTLEGNPTYAAQPLEKQVLYGKKPTPHFDLLRAMHVSDSTPDDQRRLRLCNVRVVAGDKIGSPIELEAIPKGVIFTAALTLDGFLCRDAVATQQLGWEEDQLLWIRRLPTVVNAFTEVRLHDEMRWRDTPGPMRSFYRELMTTLETLDKKVEFVLQLGWGGGWDSKTFGAILMEEKTAFTKVVKRYAKHLDRQRSFKSGDRFPKSRRLVLNAQNIPARPLGWIHVKMEPVR